MGRLFQEDLSLPFFPTGHKQTSSYDQLLIEKKDPLSLVSSQSIQSQDHNWLRL